VPCPAGEVAISGGIDPGAAVPQGFVMAGSHPTTVGALSAWRTVVRNDSTLTVTATFYAVCAPVES
jgi:hypothetical protein